MAAGDAGLEIIPERRLKGRLLSVLRTETVDSFITKAEETLELTLEGIPGDRHHGFTRPSGSREPWYRRGTEMQSCRQLSIVSREELEEIARLMEIPRVDPGWIGANLVVEGVPHLSYLPPATLLFLDGGAVVRVEQMNGPCRYAGEAIAANFPDRAGLDMLFPKVAKRLRGVVASVDRAGSARAGDTVKVHLREQWIY